MPSFWEQYLEDWNVGFKFLYSSAQDTYREAVEANPLAYEPSVRAFMTGLEQVRADLDYIRPRMMLVAGTPNYKTYAATIDKAGKDYLDLAAPFYADTKPVQKPNMGGAGLIIGIVLVGIAAICWSQTGNNYIKFLREQTGLGKQDLEARMYMNSRGMQLQQSTTPQPEAPTKKVAGMGYWPLVAVGALAAVYVLPIVMKRSGNG